MPNDSRRFYRVGGLTFCLDSPDFPEQEKLSLFRVPPCGADVTCAVQLVPEVPRPAGEPVYQSGRTAWYPAPEGLVRVLFDEKDGGVLMTDTPKDGRHEVLFRADRADGFGTNLALRCLDMPRRMIECGGVFLHASFIERNGEAILFTAPKQTGKSTQAALWNRYRGAEIVNGDRALLRRRDGRWYAWGSPYCGTSDILLNRELPLRAVVILARGEVSRAERTSTRRALAAMLDGCSYEVWDAAQVSAVTDICAAVITEVPFYTLFCTQDESAVIALEEVL